jgi:hypothetical protein
MELTYDKTFTGDWYIGTRNQGFDFVFPSVPSWFHGNMKLAVEQYDLEPSIDIDFNGYKLVNGMNCADGVRQWFYVDVPSNLLNVDGDNIVRIYHDGGGDDWGNIYNVRLYYDSTGQGVIGPQDGEWHFMCIRFNGNNIQFQIDDMRKDIANGDGVWDAPPVFEPQMLGIGCDSTGYNRSANVYIDELRCDAIYLSDDEVEAWRISNRPFYDPYDYCVIEMGPAPKKYIKNFGSYRAWDDGSLAKSAYDYRYPDPSVGEYTGDVGSGVYKIKTSTGEILDVYCDMETAGGGWTLLVCSDDYTGWDSNTVKERNISSPAIAGNYSCLRLGDSIKHDFSGKLRYRIDAQALGRWGGIWEAPFTESFTRNSLRTTISTNIVQWDVWTIDTATNDTASPTNLMPWIKEGATQLFSTWGNAGSWWGTVVGTNSGYHPAPWIHPQMPNPGVIWYWVQ